MATVVLFHSGDSQRAEEEMISEVLAPWLGLCRWGQQHGWVGLLLHSRSIYAQFANSLPGGGTDDLSQSSEGLCAYNVGEIATGCRL
ncbi:hypothetical protein [Thermogemmatispora sp.]|uniref:hypothetical protein n=1 Tax=Thermogemmatispora sp. TaxID=1968838 RepID=UPI0035E46355